MSKASLQELGAWLVELALIQSRDHAPYSYYGDGPKPDPLLDTATGWGIEAEAIKAAVTEPAKPSRTTANRAAKR